jgi:cytosine deaminase
MSGGTTSSDSGATLPGLRNVRLCDGSYVDMRFDAGRIASVTPALPRSAAASQTVHSDGRLDVDGLLALPPLVEAHIHLDKTLLGLPFIPHLPGESVSARIAQEKRLRRELSLSVFTRGRALVHQITASGTGHIRSHVDIDGELGLLGLDEVLSLRDNCAGLATIQIVAFPQNGILRDPPVSALLAEALRNGAGLIGGIDPAGIDGDIRGHLDIVFSLAERFGVGIDIHLHDPGELGLFELCDIARRSEAASMQGRVAVSHAFALGSSLPQVPMTIDALARGGVSIVTNGPSRTVCMPPVKQLIDAGIRVVAGSDNVRDAWSPHGDGDMLRRAGLIAYQQDFRSDSDLDLALAMATTSGARLLGLQDYGLRQGGPADMVLLAAGSGAEAVASVPSRDMVIRAGRVIARRGMLV